MATSPNPTAIVMYQAGAMGLPVTLMSQVAKNWAPPPTT
jgi:hypothetical protein